MFLDSSPMYVVCHINLLPSHQRAHLPVLPSGLASTFCPCAVFAINHWNVRAGRLLIIYLMSSSHVRKWKSPDMAECGYALAWGFVYFLCLPLFPVVVRYVKAQHMNAVMDVMVHLSRSLVDTGCTAVYNPLPHSRCAELSCKCFASSSSPPLASSSFLL